MSKYFEEAVHERAAEAARLVSKKQRDYGTSNILHSPLGAELGIAVRLYDKISRLVNLVQKGTAPSNESLADTAADITGYGLVLIMLLNGEFTLPLLDDGTPDDKPTLNQPPMYEQIKDEGRK